MEKTFSGKVQISTGFTLAQKVNLVYMCYLQGRQSAQLQHITEIPLDFFIFIFASPFPSLSSTVSLPFPHPYHLSLESINVP